VDGSTWLEQLASCSSDGTVKVLAISPATMVSGKSHQSRLRPKEKTVLQVTITNRPQPQETGAVESQVVTLRSMASFTSLLPEEEEKKEKEEAKEATKRSFPDPRIAIHRVKWNPNLPASGWLLSGTCAGLLHGLGLLEGE